MKEKSRFLKYSSAVVALIGTVLLVAGAASAGDHKLKSSDDPARVVAHISFSGLSPVDMTMQKQSNGKYYVYVQHANNAGISIIDVSKPAETKAVAIMPYTEPTAFSSLNLTGNLAIVTDTRALPTRTNTSNGDLVLWDLSNPAAPRIVRQFSGVVKWLQDEREFVYVLNGDGLWVVSNAAGRAPDQAESSDVYGG